MTIQKNSKPELSRLTDGLFVIIMLDPLAMVGPRADPALKTKCQAFQGERYLAIVGLKPFQTTSNLQDELEFHVVSQGLPTSGIDDQTCLPILPETSHPFREPLRPKGTSLSIQNCYYHSHGSTFLLGISSIEGFQDYGYCPRRDQTYLSLDDLDRLDTLAIEDGAYIAPESSGNDAYQEACLPFKTRLSLSLKMMISQQMIRRKRR